MSDIVQPLVVSLSFLYPSDTQPVAGVFVRERVLLVGEKRPAVVVSPQPWSPFDWLIRRAKAPGYRVQPKVPNTIERGTRVYRPKFFSLPMFGRSLDGYMICFAVLLCLKRNVRQRIGLIDAHFVYPDGFAAMLVARFLQVPYMITLRGERDTACEHNVHKSKVQKALMGAAHVVSVSDDLREFAVRMGTKPLNTSTIANGVDLTAFFPENQSHARERLGIRANLKVLVSVGSLSDRKGHHRVISALTEIRKTFPNCLLLIVGGGTSFEDQTEYLQSEISRLNLAEFVRLCGQKDPSELRWYFSAADLFVLATAHEGRANVMNEALACGLPVVTTDVGGNKEIVSGPEFGSTVTFWDERAFVGEVCRYLKEPGNNEARLTYAARLTWSNTASQVLQRLDSIMGSKV